MARGCHVWADKPVTIYRHIHGRLTNLREKGVLIPPCVKQHRREGSISAGNPLAFLLQIWCGWISASCDKLEHLARFALGRGVMNNSDPEDPRGEIEITDLDAPETHRVPERDPRRRQAFARRPHVWMSLAAIAGLALLALLVLREGPHPSEPTPVTKVPLPALSLSVVAGI